MGNEKFEVFFTSCTKLAIYSQNIGATNAENEDY